MVALALDIGETRIGIAVSSRDGKMAMPVKVLPAAEVTGMAKTFRYLVEDYEPDILVSGRPLAQTVLYLQYSNHRLALKLFRGEPAISEFD